MNPYLSVLIQAALPIWELRGALPVALKVYHLPLWQAFLICVAGNIIPVIFWIYFLEGISKFLMERFKFWRNFFNWLFERTRKKHSRRFEVWGDLALIAFVAIPLPFTGGWTGSVAAFVFGVPPKKSIPLILAGIIIAGIIVAIFILSLNKVL